MAPIKTDEWVWGKERIVWGFDPAHQYTCKVLEPKRGRAGCLSLQYHDKKSESWIVYRGVAWALAIVGGQVCTRIMRRGDIQNLPQGVVHRLMGASDDVQVIEPSTPDAHAADKSVPKDVVRLHCVQGRPASPARDAKEAAAVVEAVRVTEEAIAAIEQGREPLEIRRELFASLGAYSLS